MLIVGGPSEQTTQFEHETWLYQLRGSATVRVDGKDETLAEEDCCIIKPNTPYKVTRPAGSIGMVVTQHPLGNKPGQAAKGDK